VGVGNHRWDPLVAGDSAADACSCGFERTVTTAAAARQSRAVHQRCGRGHLDNPENFLLVTVAGALDQSAWNWSTT
jgi:hypothetical protein